MGTDCASVHSKITSELGHGAACFVALDELGDLIRVQQADATLQLDVGPCVLESYLPCRRLRTFGTTTPELLRMRDWLLAARVTLVGMESTGVFWKPVYYLLEDVVESWLLNARHLKKVPGRKSDVSDSEWIADLVAHGLVRPSFVPPPPVRRLRDLTRYRTALTQERTREVQRLQNLLEDAGVKLDCVVSDITGKSARLMLDALIAGERDPRVLAQYAQGRMRPKIPALEHARMSRVPWNFGGRPISIRLR